MKFYIILFLVSVNYIFCKSDKCEHYEARSRIDCIDFYSADESQGRHCCYSRERLDGKDYEELF